jgi:hypothetical protein
MNGGGIIIPGGSSSGLVAELRAKALANKFLDVAHGYDNRELLAALSLCTGCTIRARYPRQERSSALTVSINIMQECINQP